MTTRRHANFVRQRGFTLIEMIVVLALLALFATIAIPRFGDVAVRRFDQSAREVADMFLMVAQRDQLSGNQLGLSMQTRPDGRVMLVFEILDRPPNSDLETAVSWRPDPFVKPVVFPDSVDLETIVATSNDEPLDLFEWPLRYRPGDGRPAIRFAMEMRNEDRIAVISLPSYGIAPSVVINGKGDETVSRDVVDLDAIGRSRESW